jgi:S-adenosylmethionine:tRNA ribosyltransferase-isomerase
MSAPAFELPESLEAAEPPEARGLARDEVRLMVATRHDGRIAHARFHDLPELLAPGDLVVVNVSATLPAAIPAARAASGSAARVHISTRAPRLDPNWRVVELRSADGSRPARGRAGERIHLAGGATLELIAPYASGARLMLARFDGPEWRDQTITVEDYLIRHGEPIRYGYVWGKWPIDDYQTVYATTPGSAEMPSAGRPLTTGLITRLVATGVLVAPITLHTGVSSPERHEAPFPEYFEVPDTTALLIDQVHARGGRVIAVGTTVVRALESAADRTACAGAEPGEQGAGAGARGWTSLVISPERGLRVIDGLITGWHEPEASHLSLLEAATGAGLLESSYREAIRRGYLWHEFGDSHLVLP